MTSENPRLVGVLQNIAIGPQDQRVDIQLQNKIKIATQGGYSLFQRAHDAIPECCRHGPLVAEQPGEPVAKRRYYDMYREVADTAGVPAEVWNARARHGGVSEGKRNSAGNYDVVVSQSLSHPGGGALLISRFLHPTPFLAPGRTMRRDTRRPATSPPPSRALL